MLHFLFSFRGRVNLARFWIFCIASSGAAGVLGLASMELRQRWVPLPGDAKTVTLPWPLGWTLNAWDVAFTILIALLIYCVIAVIVKRLHDRGKSALWLVLYYGAPTVSYVALRAAEYSPTTASPTMQAIQHGVMLVNFVIITWYLVEILLLPGTRGDNRFGPDPRRIDQPQSPA